MIHQLEMAREQWLAGDTTAVRNVLGRVGSHPETARQWRGTVWLTFDGTGEVEPLTLAPVRDFTRRVHEELPHVFYFLDADSGAVALYLSTFTDAVPGTLAIAVTPAMLAELRAALIVAAEYAIDHGDDWVAAVSPHVRLVDHLRLSDIRDALLASAHMR